MKSVVFVAALAVAAFAGCKQGKGERCQITDDCDDNLVCNQATQTCADTTGTGSIDANLPPDAPADAKVIDAPMADALVDGPPDAPL